MAKRLNLQNLKRGVHYFKRNGLSSSYYKAKERLLRDEDESLYDKMVHDAALSTEELIKQKKTVFKRRYLISIVVPAYMPDPVVFNELLESVAAQTYQNWELCIADAGDPGIVMPVIHSFVAKHSLDKDANGGIIDIRQKIKYTHLEKNRGISINTNEALKLAKGSYVAFLDHDDVLSPDALYEVMKVLNKTSHAINSPQGASLPPKFIYSDEDKLSFDATQYFDWHRKPDYDPLLLLTNNYICHLTVVETELARQVGGFDPIYDGAQDYDFILRCIERLSVDQIVHIPKVLYHWRSSKGSTAENPDAKLYAYDAGRKAVCAHLGRRGITAEVLGTEHLGFANINFGENKFSIKTFTPHEYEALNEEGFNSIEDDLILVLSENLNPLQDYITLMSGVMMLNEVGAVTGKIIKNGKIESCGYEKGKGGGISPCFAGMNVHYSGYMHRANLLRSVDAFDTGCVMYKKSALKWNGDGTVLCSGYLCAIEPNAVFVRK